MCRANRYQKSAIVQYNHRKYFYKKSKINDIATQVYALQFYKQHAITQISPSYLLWSKTEILIEWVEGTCLIDYDTRSMSIHWWKKLMNDICRYLFALDKYNINHNDFADHNIIVTRKGIIVIDHQWFTSNQWVPNVIKMASKETKIKLGWSSHYRVGTDMNQILGCLSHHCSIPSLLKSWILTHIVCHPQSEYPYANKQPLPHLQPSKIWDLIIQRIADSVPLTVNG